MTLKELATEELRRSLSTQDFVISVLRTAILTSVFAPGATLRQADLAEQLGVSHIPVREAIRSLASQGLVTLYPHRGAVVSRLSPEEAEEIFAIRLFLESGALKTALPNMTPRADSCSRTWQTGRTPVTNSRLSLCPAPPYPTSP